MSELPNPERENTVDEASKGKSGTKVTAPYETALNKAFDKLTSEIFIFLLAYTMLLIALVTSGSAIPSGLRELLIIIPLAGILAYGWLRKRTVIREPNARGIRVTALFVKDSTVTGVEAPPEAAGSSHGVNVRVGVATEGGRVVGRGGGRPSSEDGYLLATFEKLTDTNKRALIDSAHRLLDEQERRGG